MRNDTRVISEAFWEENIHYPHNKWEVVFRQSGNVCIRPICFL